MLLDTGAPSGRQYWGAGNIKKAETAQISNSQMWGWKPYREGRPRIRSEALLCRPPSCVSPNLRLVARTQRWVSPSQWFLFWSQSVLFLLFNRERAVTGWAPEPRPAAATRSDPSPSSRFLKTPAGRQSATPETHQIIIIIIINSRRRRKRPQTSLLCLDFLCRLLHFLLQRRTNQRRRKVWLTQVISAKAAEPQNQGPLTCGLRPPKRSSGNAQLLHGP